MPLRINIIANTIIEPGMSGGNRIFIECAKRWTKQGIKIKVFTSDAGKDLCRLNGLEKVDFKVWNLPYKKERFSKFEAFFLYILGVIVGSFNAFKTKFEDEKKIIYSSSDFWPDSMPGLIMKLRHPSSVWVAGFYLFVPNPFTKESPYKGKRLIIGLFYYLSQKPIYWLVKRYADMVFVTSEPDIKNFISKRLPSSRVIAIRGGVDIKIPALVPEPKEKEYDAVFIGRFHPQKGVLKLIDIWKLVCKKKRKAKLAMIGIGELEKDIQEKIERDGLENNIELLGFKDGTEKIKIFKSSKIVLHPAIYDSGGMAACEAMACGLPGVSFDLEALKTYYPKGMIKTPCYDFKAFAQNIIELLEDEELYIKMREDSITWAKEWDWDKRAEDILKIMRRLFMYEQDENGTS